MMSPNWQTFCRAKDLSVDGDSVDVTFENGRRHRVFVATEPDGFSLRAKVVRPSTVEVIVDLALTTWLRNRATKLVGFRVDKRGWLVGEAWVPTAGLTPSEFQTYVRAVAAESDRFEYAITGRDIE